MSALMGAATATTVAAREDRFQIVTEAQVVLVAVDERGAPTPIRSRPA